jgi:hydroxylysine kinase
MSADGDPVGIDIGAVLRTYYGIAGRATRLASEIEPTFVVAIATGGEVLLKLAVGTEAARDAGFQVALLDHLEAADPDLIVPRLIRTVRGEAQARLPGGVSARVLSFLPGRLMKEAPRSLLQAHRLGGWLARIGVALQGFEHPNDHRPVPWDITRASELRPMLDALDDPARRSRAAAWLDRLEDDIAPRLAAFRRQVVHNDLNLDNILVDAADPDRITGIIDFGDAVRTVLVSDVAIAIAYQLVDEGDTLALAGPFLAGYDAVTPLTETEIAVLPDLIAMRFVMIALIGAFRARAAPDNAAYLLRNHERAWARLARIEAVGTTALARALAAARNGAHA